MGTQKGMDMERKPLEDLDSCPVCSCHITCVWNSGPSMGHCVEEVKAYKMGEHTFFEEFMGRKS